MTSEEFKILTDTVEIKKVSFDGYELNLEFLNGITVTVEPYEEWGSPIFNFQTNLEIEKERIEFNRRQAAEQEKKRQVEAKQNEFLSKFPKEQWEEIKKTFRM